MGMICRYRLGGVCMVCENVEVRLGISLSTTVKKTNWKISLLYAEISPVAGNMQPHLTSISRQDSLVAMDNQREPMLKSRGFFQQVKNGVSAGNNLRETCNEIE